MKNESSTKSSQTFISARHLFFFVKGRAVLCVWSHHLLTFLVLTCDKWCVWEELEACFIVLFHLLEHLRTQPLQTLAFVENFDETLFISEGQLQEQQQKGGKRATAPGSRAAHLLGLVVLLHIEFKIWNKRFASMSFSNPDTMCQVPYTPTQICDSGQIVSSLGSVTTPSVWRFHHLSFCTNWAFRIIQKLPSRPTLESKTGADVKAREQTQGCTQELIRLNFTQISCLCCSGSRKPQIWLLGE